MGHELCIDFRESLMQLVGSRETAGNGITVSATGYRKCWLATGSILAFYRL
jgi:hypothetical protein